jgi:uncharacterized protein (DUF4415 family)
MNAESIKKNSASRTNFAKLHRKDDTGIDYRDIPETDAKFWEGAEVVMPKHKVHLSVRFDEDIVDYFKKKGKGYQSRMNAVLRTYVKSHVKKHAA